MPKSDSLTVDNEVSAPKALVDAVQEYHSRYRHPDLDPPEFSALYALYPDRHDSTQYGWPETWPHNGRSGVYFFLDQSLDLLYLGTTYNLGARFNSYLQYGPDGTCSFNRTGWTSDPYYLLAVSTNKFFEADSLEAYLIAAMRPPNNKNGASYEV